MESKPVLERPIEDRERADLFERHRPRLRGIAYRMLGSLGDAEDIVQEAYLRWHIWSSFRSRSGVINLWNRRAIGFRYTHPVGAPQAT
jgi:DNA-directed RNA polymerase specialized sigma24 family protein